MNILWLAFGVPQRGTAYQPRVEPWDFEYPEFMAF